MSEWDKVAVGENVSNGNAGAPLTSPLGALAGRIKDWLHHHDRESTRVCTCHQSGSLAHQGSCRLLIISDCLAQEALTWVEEQLPTREKGARVLYATKYPKQASYYDAGTEKTREEYRRMADALLALLREKLKGEKA